MENQTTEPQVQSDTKTVSDQSQQTQPTTLGTPVVAEQPKEDTVDFKSLIPESFKDEKSLENFDNMEDLLKSYLHAQKMVGADKIPVPNKFATDEDWKEVFTRLGAPKSPEDYKYSFKDDQVDPNQLKSFNETAHRLGLLPKQAEALVKYYNDLNKGQSEQLEAQAIEAQTKTEADLKKEFGPQFNKRLDQAKRLAINTLGEDFLNKTVLKDGSRLGDNLEVIKAFSNLADKLSEDEIVKGEGSDYQTVKDIEKQIAELTQQGSAYWQNQHPNHKQAVDEVFKLREMLHN
jgi:hypothetical protein